MHNIVFTIFKLVVTWINLPIADHHYFAVAWTHPPLCCSFHLLGFFSMFRPSIWASSFISSLFFFFGYSPICLPIFSLCFIILSFWLLYFIFLFCEPLHVTNLGTWEIKFSAFCIFLAPPRYNTLWSFFLFFFYFFIFYYLVNNNIIVTIL